VVDVDVPAAELTVVPVGSSADLRIGEAVMAVGAPFGYQGTATTGVVSGLGRSITSPNGFSVPDALQTDAAINRGNSGGALLNADGELVGVPTQIADSGVPAFVGVAFAVPSDTATRVVEQILADGEVDYAWLGVSTASVDETLQGVDGIGAEQGALITGLAMDGPAERAGLRLGDTVEEGLTGPVCAGGDVVTALDGEPIADGQALQLAVAAREPGAVVDLTVVGPDGAQRTVEVTLGERPQVAPETRLGCVD
ncbi:MAG: trypsin-like peptidase domain-containing protein, partial [Miltoncostaeaceae bacterium]